MKVTVGLDVGGTKILAVALDEFGRVQGERRSATPADSADALLVALGDAVRGVMTAVPEGELVSVGIGLPGFLSAEGIPRQAPNLPSSIGLDVRGALARQLGVPVVVDNDANCAAWASSVIDAPGAESVVMVTFGTGIGGGIVIDGALVRGANGFAGEPGHMIVDVDGWPCVCGQSGCWEMYASGSGLGRLGRAAAVEGRAPNLLAAAGGDAARIDGPLVGDSASSGDADAAGVLDEYARWIAVGLVNLINVLDPAVIVLGGGVVDLGSALMDRVEAALAAFPTMVGGRSTPVRLSSLGSSAGAVGAALLAAERLTGAPRPSR